MPKPAPTLVFLLVVLLASTTRLAAGEPPRLAPRVAEALDVSFSDPRSIGEIYRQLAERYGFTVTFERGLDNLLEDEMRFTASEVTASEALDLLSAAAGFFWQPLDGSTVVVARDTPQSRRTYQHVVVHPFHLDHLEARDALTLLRTLVDLRKLAVVEPSLLVVRDTAEKAALAETLLERLDVPPGRVEVAVEVLTLDGSALPGLAREVLDAERYAALKREARAQVLAAPQLGLVGRSVSSYSLRSDEPAPGGSERPLSGFEVQVSAPVPPSDREVALEIALRLVQPSDSGALTQGLETRLAIPPGATRLLTGWWPAGAPAPGRETTGEGRTTVVAITPTAVEVPALATAELEAIWMGTETRQAAPR